MDETKLEIRSDAGEIEIPSGICCNCARSDRVGRVESELKLTRYFGLAGSEYTFRWELPYCSECEATASRTPVNRLHIALVTALCTISIFLLATIVQMAMDRSLLGGNDLWFALAASIVLVWGFYASRKPRGRQTSYYQPIRILKLRQKFSSGEVTGIVLGFTNGSYMRRFREANLRSLAG